MNEKLIWDKLIQHFSLAGTAGLMGNLYAESALNSQNLQNSFEKKLGYSDETYTRAVDNGTYQNFVTDCAGYGLAQWTYWKRKQDLLQYAQSVGKSIGDGTMQIDFLLHELENNYRYVYQYLTTAVSVKDASDIVMTKFENPADQSETAKAKRAKFSQNFYDKYADATPELTTPDLSEVHFNMVTAIGSGTVTLNGKNYAVTLTALD